MSHGDVTQGGESRTTGREETLARHLTVASVVFGILLAAGQGWSKRFIVNSDGLSYLELGAAVARGDWSGAMNAVWSPLYPILLGGALWALRPRPYWEGLVIQLVHLFMYVLALLAFQFFLRQLIRYHRLLAARWDCLAIPPSAFVVLGYAVFLWNTHQLMGTWRTYPDMLVAACVLTIAGLILRIRLGAMDWRTFLLLGAVLGLGYLAKAPMFSLGFLLALTALLAAPDRHRALPRALAAVLLLLAIGSPYIMAISLDRGRLTFGESARYNYARFVNGVGVAVHWQGGPSAVGEPVHPTRQLSEAPAVYEFATPLSGVYPPWTDPAYWYEGVDLYLDVRAQARKVMQSIRAYADMIEPGLVALWVLLLFVTSGL